MRKLVYVLSDNTCVTDLKSAVASDLGYTAKTVEVPEPSSPMSEKKRAARKACYPGPYSE